MPSFADYFKENMDALGLPTPSTIFSSIGSAVSNAAAISNAIKTFGPNVTIQDLIGAGTVSEELSVAGALSASYYVGAVIGSTAVAIGRVISDGASISDLLIGLNNLPVDLPSWWPSDYSGDYSVAVDGAVAAGDGGYGSGTITYDGDGGDGSGGDGGFGGGGDTGGGGDGGGGDGGGGGGGGGGGEDPYPVEEERVKAPTANTADQTQPQTASSAQLVQAMSTFAVPTSATVEHTQPQVTTTPVLAHAAA
ncbi:hypothetical protein [Duganella sp.]|uniref:hypothetical protein n=1 Tax=Duganella sp. TaxID=1904440 RepID=UPI0031D79DC6